MSFGGFRKHKKKKEGKRKRRAGRRGEENGFIDNLFIAIYAIGECIGEKVI